ncbi:hypothetical protein [Streptomyces sp. NPDC047028]|uniref:hypothetical protein n=1 Tax=Streptomyces sp. NPDC047028 TaxID=3155793 RepID=UPI0033C9C8DD
MDPREPAVQPPQQADDSGPGIRDLLKTAWADPVRLPEGMALHAVQREHAHAVAAVARLRADRPGASAEDLGEVVVARGVRRTVIEGSAVGGPFMILVPFAFCAAWLSQARMVFELASLAETGGCPRRRAAELLVLQGAYATAAEAEVRLAAAAQSRDTVSQGRFPSGTRLACLRRLALLLGLIEPERHDQGWLRRAAGWLVTGLLIVAGFMAPLLWIPVMGGSYRRATTRLARRAQAYYRGGSASGAGVRRLSAWQPAGVLILLRTGLSLIVPVAALLVAVRADLRLSGSRFVAAAAAAVVASLVVATLMGARHWRRRHTS